MFWSLSASSKGFVMSFRLQAVGETDEWYTPAYIFEALNVEFDLDVASPGPSIVPWIPAKRYLNKNSLTRQWTGFVWMNPPFKERNGLVPWLDKFFKHGNGIALVPDRTSAPWWQEFVPKSNAILFVSPKVRFIDAGTMKPGSVPAQGSCLLASGKIAAKILQRASLDLGTLMIPYWWCERAK